MSETTSQNHYIGRFAPSPTGPLHVGSLVAALASYVDAKSHRGQWLVRIEDVDTQRCSRDHEATILKQLRCYGFVNDGEVVRQSDRTNHYREALATLHGKNLTYRCRCTRKMLADAPRNRDGETIYPGTCRELNLGETKDEPTSIRLNLQKLSDTNEISFDDRSLGKITQNVQRDVGDFVLLRADGDFAYQLAVVVDDAMQGITHVVRGADLLSNTARQLVLQRALGLPTPCYLHVPIATNDRGEKLSKQTLAPTLPEAPHAIMQTLREAWSFLRQDDLPHCHTPEDFLCHAVAAWRPEHLYQSSRERASANL